MTTLFEKLLNKQIRLSVIGLGYFRLTITHEFARKIAVTGFDIREDRGEIMRNEIDRSEELKHEYGLNLFPLRVTRHAKV